jgi:hypothetical protein
MRRSPGVLVLSCVAAGLAIAPASAQQPSSASRPHAAVPAQAAPAAPSSQAVPPEQAPTEPQLGLPIYPGAQFIRSYDAGRGQRYYLFGTTATFEQAVAFYRGALKDRGELVFERPATHMFEVGRYRVETMAFPPGVTVKDFTWGGSPGYPNPLPHTPPARFPTVLQLVPMPF